MWMTTCLSALALWASPVAGQAATSASAPIAEGPAARTAIEVHVVEVTGGQAYLSAGESAGLQRGDHVVFAGGEYVVVAVARDSALLDVGEHALVTGDSGHTMPAPAIAVAVAERLPAPVPLDRYVGQWASAKVPSTSQHPKNVPLGEAAIESRVDAMLAAANADVITSASVIARSELRGRVRYEPWRDVPLRFDVDGAGVLWYGDGLPTRAGDTSRPDYRVYQLQAGYGSDRSWYAAGGRLRYAAQSLGMLDGVRAQAPVGGDVVLGAFGGVVPSALDGQPSTEVARFGAEARVDAPEHAWRPALSLTAYGLRFAGALDERRLIASGDAYPDEHHIGAYAEVAFNDSKNAWGAPATELSAVGAEGSLRFDPWEVGARLDMQRPERSRYLASILPEGFLCIAKPQADPPVGESCHGDDARYLATADATLRQSNGSLTLTTLGSTSQNAGSTNVGGVLQGRIERIVNSVHLDGSVSTQRGTLVSSYGFGAGVGSGFLNDRMDITLRYRPHLLYYAAGGGTLVEHSLTLEFWTLPWDEFEFSAEAERLLGPDDDALLIFGVLAWRPTGT
jgi:hypothetical protein